MKKKLLIILISAGGFISPTWANQIGTIAMAIGKVDVRTKGGAWQRASSGMPISANTELQTSLKGKAVIEMTTGTKINVNPGSVMSFDNFVKGGFGTATDVSLKMGKISAVVARTDSDARNHFRVKTPTAVAGVRGTWKIIGYTPDTGTSVQLLESAADVIGAGGRRMLVQQGSTTNAGTTGMLPPDTMASQDDNVVLGNNSMSADEMDFFFEAGDSLFSGNPNDFNDILEFSEEFNNDFFEELFGNFERIEFEKL